MWIEIKISELEQRNEDRRSPHGERGLKFADANLDGTITDASLPARGAWIEILLHSIALLIVIVSLPARGAWIEIFP